MIEKNPVNRAQVVQSPLTRLRPAKTAREPGMETGYPIGPVLDLRDRQRFITQSAQRPRRRPVTPHAVAVLSNEYSYQLSGFIVSYVHE